MDKKRREGETAMGGWLFSPVRVATSFEIQIARRRSLPRRPRQLKRSSVDRRQLSSKLGVF